MNEDKTAEREQALGCVCFLLLPLTIVLDGAVLGQLWSWFVVPLGLPAITTGQAIGVALVFRFLSRSTKRREQMPRNSEMLASAFLYPPIALGIGWILAWFV